MLAAVYHASVRQPQVPYLRIAEDLRSKIEHGELRPGEQVPSVTQIAETYNVSRSTARRALDKLKEWGLTEALSGWGTFVKERP
jgi:DNA-binding GntR family transcriptional regulator